MPYCPEDVGVHERGPPPLRRHSMQLLVSHIVQPQRIPVSAKTATLALCVPEWDHVSDFSTPTAFALRAGLAMLCCTPQRNGLSPLPSYSVCTYAVSAPAPAQLVWLLGTRLTPTLSHPRALYTGEVALQVGLQEASTHLTIATRDCST